MLRAQTFPENWVGSYSGDMILGYTDRPSDTIHTDLEIKPLIDDSVWTYKMTFKSKRYGEIVKDYVIRIADKNDPKKFILDELNSIQIPMNLMDNCFYTNYEVDGMLYMSSLRLFEDQLIYDLYCSTKEGKRTDRIEEGQSVFVVDSYAVTLHQTAFFKRK